MPYALFYYSFENDTSTSSPDSSGNPVAPVFGVTDWEWIAGPRSIGKQLLCSSKKTFTL
jgi:hypothetical protein